MQMSSLPWKYGRVGQHRQAGRAAGLHRRGRGRADRNRRGSGPRLGEAFLISAIRPKRPVAQPALQRGGEAARRRCLGAARSDRPQGRAALRARDLLALVGADTGEDVSSWIGVRALVIGDELVERPPRRAAVDRLRPPIATPSRRSLGRAGDDQRGGALSSTMSRSGPSRAAEQLAQQSRHCAAARRPQVVELARGFSPAILGRDLESLRPCRP